jgi:hypothetical protein
MKKSIVTCFKNEALSVYNEYDLLESAVFTVMYANVY